MNFNNNPKIDEINRHISENSKIVKIDLKKLSINGSCIAEPMAKYLENKAIQSSNIKECSYSPKAFLASYNGENKPEPTDAMNLGTFVHSAILEPELYDKFVVKPKCDLRTKEGLKDSIRFLNRLTTYSYDVSDLEDQSYSQLKEFNQMLTELTKHLVIEEEHKEKIDKIRESINSYQNGLIPRLLEGSQKEISIYSIEPITGLSVKIRPDAINVAENIGRNAIISVKTTSTKSISEFIQQCITLQYEVSEAFYQDIASHVTGLNFDTTIMIVAQTVEPYDSYVMVWEAPAIDCGRYKYGHNLDIIKECFDKNHFPSINAKAPIGNNGIFQLNYPDGVMSREQEYINLEIE